MKRTIAFPTRFVRTVDELEMEVVRMARLHQRELKTLKNKLANQPARSDGGADEDLFGPGADADGGVDGAGAGDDGDLNDGADGGGGGGAGGGAGGDGDADGTTRVEALTLQLHARNETIREVLKEKEDLYVAIALVYAWFSTSIVFSMFTAIADSDWVQGDWLTM